LRNTSRKITLIIVAIIENHNQAEFNKPNTSAKLVPKALSNGESDIIDYPAYLTNSR
jgi:hypothetical protein